MWNKEEADGDGAATKNTPVFTGVWPGACPLHRITGEVLHRRQTHCPKISVPYGPTEGHRRIGQLVLGLSIDVTPGESPKGPQEPLSRGKQHTEKLLGLCHNYCNNLIILKHCLVFL